MITWACIYAVTLWLAAVHILDPEEHLWVRLAWCGALFYQTYLLVLMVVWYP